MNNGHTACNNSNTAIVESIESLTKTSFFFVQKRESSTQRICGKNENEIYNCVLGRRGEREQTNTTILIKIMIKQQQQ